ncbi:hypothetical protein [Amycolatopsis sp.]|jgi:hypothetical protein|uniref:hypothetical protein n=1 Tax=Amycolatopsis sp. TaxID=37632 RepID=UPI002E0CC229|nr:hypothetical protein [Amycolatopsis sp.]
MGQPNTAPGATPAAAYTDLGRGQAQADFASASAASGWEFDRDAMDRVIKSLDDSIHNEYQRAQDEAVWLAQIIPPGDEVGSQGYVASANASGASYQQFLVSAVNYTTAYRDTLIVIRDAYQNQDQASLDALRGIRKAD